MRLLVAAGGTGGHVFPAVAIAQAMQQTRENTEVLFVGTPHGMENELVPEAKFPIKLIGIGGFKGKGLVQRLKSIASLPGACWSSWKILKEFSPTVVFGIGGYASGPLLLLAALNGFKTAVLEPNAIPGFSNRILSRFVDQIFVAFEEAIGRLPQNKCIVSGNPIRRQILDIQPPDFEKKEKWTLLVFGGSQGAHRINTAVCSMLPSIKEFRDRLSFVHQTGMKDEESVRKAYKEAGFQADVKAFINDMAQAYARSDLVLARSGSSVLEIASCGRPAILVPYPHAADDHQRANASVVGNHGAAIIIKDSECDGRTLTRTLKKLLSDNVYLKEMSEAAQRFRRENAASEIAGSLLSLAGNGGMVS